MASDSWFTYPITRPFTLPHLTAILSICGVIWVTFVTIISIATVGYQNIVIQSTSLNLSNPLWYERLLPGSTLGLESRKCDTSQIKMNQDGISLRPWYPNAVLSTSSDIFMEYIVEATAGITTAFNEVPYRNYALRNCSVRELKLVQLNSPVADLRVQKAKKFLNPVLARM